jgi:cell division protein FtsW
MRLFDADHLQARGHRGDYSLAIAVFILLAFGLVMMYNINPALNQKLGGAGGGVNYFRNQLINVVVATVAWAVAGGLYYKLWRRYAVALLITSIVLLVALLVPHLSFTTNGATRWLRLGPLSFQPAELLKLALVVYLAAWLEQRREQIRSFEGIRTFAIMIAVTSVVVVVFQRDLGTMLVLALAALGMLYVAGSRISDVLMLIGLGVFGAVVAIAAFPHRLSRLTTFLHPTQDVLGGAYHINQALIGIGSGGLLGVGLGKSVQIYGYLPEAPNDSIFAVIGEEFGLLGALLIIGIFGFIVYRGLEIARNSPDNFARLVAAGLTLVIMFQAFINVAAMVSLVPLTGIPLPFVSYGGSSLVIMMIAAGMLFNISKYTLKEEAYADSRQRRGDSRPRLAGTGNRRRVAKAS